MNRDAWLSYATDSFVICLFSLGICQSIHTSLYFPVSFGYALLWVLGIHFFLSLLLWNRWTALTGISSLILMLLVWLFFIQQESNWWLPIVQFFAWAGAYVSGGTRINLSYVPYFVVSVSFLFTLIAFLFIRKKFLFTPLLLVALAVFFTEWYLGHHNIVFPMGMVFCALIVLYGREHYKRLSREMAQPSNYGAWQLWSLPIAALIVLVSFAVLPKDTNEWKWIYLVNTVEDINDFFSDYTSFKRPRTTFSLQNTGFQPLGDTLGGPVQLNSDEVLWVKAPTRIYLRGSIKNEYTGKNWLDTTESKRYRLNGRSWKEELMYTFDLQYPSKDSVDQALIDRYFEDIEIEITTRVDGPSTLFSPNRVYSIIPKNFWRIVPYFNSQGETFATRDVPERTQYTVKCSYIDFSSKDFAGFINEILEKTPPSQDERALQRTQLYTQLPSILPSYIQELALSLTQDSKTAYDKAVAIKNYLQQNFEYSLTAAVPPQDKEFVDYFLETKKGYCTYYATAMAVMARCAGIPSRYVEGYLLPSTSGTDNIYKVTNREAHAWAELFFEGIGWIPFDATPLAVVDTPTNSGGGGADYINEYEEYMRNMMEQTMPDDIDTGEYVPPKKSFHVSGLFLLSVIMAISVLFLGMLMLFNRLRFHPFLISLRHKSIEDQVAYYYRDILQLLKLYNFPMHVGDTPYTYASRVDQWLVNPEGTFMQIADIIVRMKFAHHPPEEKDMVKIRSFHKELDNDLRRMLGVFTYSFYRLLRLPKLAKKSNKKGR